MDEKKIFLAYIYRALTLLYSYLYQVKAWAVFDNMYEYEQEEQCACKDIMPTPLSSLALHYRIACELQERYPSAKRLNKNLSDCISLLLDNQLPRQVDAVHAGLYSLKYDRYNPIFTGQHPI